MSINEKIEGLENLKFNKKDNEFIGNITIDKFNLNCDVSFDTNVPKDYVGMCINYARELPDEIFKEICALLIKDCNYYSEEYNEIELPQNINGKEIIKYISDLSMQIYNHPKQNIIGFCICGNCVWNSEHGFIIVINDGKVVHYGENDNLYYPWKFDKNSNNNMDAKKYDKDKITREEYDKLFEKDENSCYIRLIIPAINDYPEMNLIGKKPEDYTIDEIVHSKKYRQFMHDKIIGNKNDLSENNNNVSNEKITNNVNSKTFKNNKNKLDKDKLKSLIRIILFGLISGLMFIIFLIQFMKEHNIIYIFISIISLISSLLCLYTPIYEIFINRKIFKEK